MKKIISVLLVVVMCLSLSSCVIHSGVKILDDGRIEMTEKIIFSETELDNIVKYMYDHKGEEIDGMVIDDEYIAQQEASIEQIKLNAIEEVVGGVTNYIVEEKSIEDSGYMSSDYTVFCNVSATELMLYSYNGLFQTEITSVFEDEFSANILAAYKEITGSDVKVEFRFTLPEKIVKTNATLVDDYTIDVVGNSSRTIYALTEKTDEALLNDENIEATIANMAKEDALNTRTAKPMVSFASKTSVRVFIDDDRFNKYAVEYKVKGGEWKLHKVIDAYNNDSCKIKNLQPGKTYYFRLTGILETEELGELRGLTSKVTSKYFATLKAPKFSLSSIKKGFKITFNKKLNEFDYYQVRYSTKKNMKKAKTAWVDGKTKKIKGLKAKTTYYVQARKSIDYVNGDWSKVKKIKTK